MRTKLTAALVRRYAEEAPPDDGEFIWDTALPRFGLRVRPPRTATAKSWSSSYVIQWPNGRIKVGSPATMTLEDARAAARSLLLQIDGGSDPRAEKAAVRDAWTVRDLAGAYLKSGEFAAKGEKTSSVDRGLITNHILHRIGLTRLADIDVPLIKRLRRDVENDQRTNRRRRRLGGPGVARKTVRLLSAMLTFATGEGRVATNCIIGNLRMTGDGTRETVLTSPAEYTALFDAMDRMVAAGRLRAYSRTFIVLAAATGMRRGEIQRLRWGDVDLEQRRIVLHETKGAKLARAGLKTEHVSLPAFAAASLAALRPEGVLPDQQIFVPQRGGFYAINRDWCAVRIEAGLPDGLTLHGLRHSVGTNEIIAGLSLSEVQQALRHRSITTTTKYVHIVENETNRLQDRAVGHLLPDAPGNAAPVLPLRRRV